MDIMVKIDVFIKSKSIVKDITFSFLFFGLFYLSLEKQEDIKFIII